MMALLPVEIDGQWIAVSAANVKEILGARSWTPIPGAAREVPGVLAWHGRAIAVMDLGRWIEKAKPLEGGAPRRRTVVATIDGYTVALPVDVVTEVEEIPERSVEAARRTDQKFARTEVELRGKILPVFDLAAAVDEVTRAAS